MEYKDPGNYIPIIYLLYSDILICSSSCVCGTYAASPGQKGGRMSGPARGPA